MLYMLTKAVRAELQGQQGLPVLMGQMEQPVPRDRPVQELQVLPGQQVSPGLRAVERDQQVQRVRQGLMVLTGQTALPGLPVLLVQQAPE